LAAGQKKSLDDDPHFDQLRLSGDDMALLPSCIFCKILSGESEASFIYKDDLVTAFMDIQPLIRGHLLVVPNHHCSSLEELEDPVGSRMFVVARQIAKAIHHSELRSEGVNLYLADGAEAGQTVFHSHLHVIPRYAGDGLKILFPASYGQRPTRRELDEIADQLRNGMIQSGSSRVD
jgi:histidine triad (HIT) family protein